ncbi:uncharacterized protein MELLADRAFT_102705 [Melampsora larici-populina 98AG31]|uniref:Uncharacterized protein n=1 Tax=Melampsora larici-populina (strain 98AG31 / pathotype 3-4-7) TaxID=747676 RepID=F4R945_MELLP|nr:uncharacterized protein MELLADRAFT_102705 [Melampsora larici-populina 98AG31]EGG11218.1 hypothetical protein MELLADRAFT_102705 [Melampsora larici-populina 98AG31]
MVLPEFHDRCTFKREVAMTSQNESFDWLRHSVSGQIAMLRSGYSGNYCAWHSSAIQIVAIAGIGLANGQFASVGLSGFGNPYGQLGGFNQFSPVGQFGTIGQFGGQQFGNQFGQGFNQFSPFGQFGGIGQFGGQQFGNAYGAYGPYGNFYRQQREARRLQLQYANLLRGQQFGYGGLGGLGGFGGFGGQYGILGGGRGGLGGLGGQFGGQQFGQLGGQVGLARPPAGYVLASSTVGLGGGGFPIRSVDTSGDQKPQGSQIQRVATGPPSDEQSNKPGCRSRSSSDGSWGHPLWWGWGDDCEETMTKPAGVAGSQEPVTGLPNAPQSQRMANTAGLPAEASPYDPKMPMMPSYGPLSQPAYQRNMAPMEYQGLNSNINGLYNSAIPMNPSNELVGHSGGQRIPFGQIGRPSGDSSLMQDNTPRPETANGIPQTPPGVTQSPNGPLGVVPEPYQSPQTYVSNQPVMNANQLTGVKPKQ